MHIIHYGYVCVCDEVSVTSVESSTISNRSGPVSSWGSTLGDDNDTYGLSCKQ